MVTQKVRKAKVAVVSLMNEEAPALPERTGDAPERLFGLDISPSGCGYREVMVNSISEYLRVIAELPDRGKRLWFRGHSKRSYKLQPNLYRNRDDKQEEDLKKLEAQLNRRFRDRAMPFGFQGRDESSDVTELQSWWRLFTMQHYGTPTRLLDWSENAFMALCFAVLDFDDGQTAEQDAAVWLLDPEQWNKIGNNNHSGILSVDEHASGPYAPLPNANQHVSSEWPIAIYGMHNSPRIVSQQGTFVVFAPGKPIPMEELASHKDFRARAKSAMTCITIARQFVSAIASELNYLGFRHSSLYPDLHGLAADLKKEVG